MLIFFGDRPGNLRILSHSRPRLEEEINFVVPILCDLLKTMEEPNRVNQTSFCPPPIFPLDFLCPLFYSCLHLRDPLGFDSRRLCLCGARRVILDPKDTRVRKSSATGAHDRDTCMCTVAKIKFLGDKNNITKQGSTSRGVDVLEDLLSRIPTNTVACDTSPQNFVEVIERTIFIVL
jgi:hypothetical protein